MPVKEEEDTQQAVTNNREGIAIQLTG